MRHWFSSPNVLGNTADFSAAWSSGRAGHEFPKAEPLPGMEPLPVNYHILADGGFAQSTLMQTPFNQAEAGSDPMKTNFNYRFSAARRIVENVFGILAARFQIFHQALQRKPEDVGLMITACLVLHNLLVKNVTRRSAAAFSFITRQKHCRTPPIPGNTSGRSTTSAEFTCCIFRRRRWNSLTSQFRRVCYIFVPIRYAPNMSEVYGVYKVIS